jgi:hypothetical protein
MFVDPISYVNKLAASPTRCSDIAPPRWNIAWRTFEGSAGTEPGMFLNLQEMTKNIKKAHKYPSKQ